MRDSVTLKIFLISVFGQCYGMAINIFHHQALKVSKDNTTKNDESILKGVTTRNNNDIWILKKYK